MQALAHHLDHGNAAGHGRLEIQRDPVLLGKRGKRCAMMGEQGLVGGDDVLAGAERGFDRILRDATVAADQLDKNIDRGILRERHGVIDKAEARNVGVAFLAAVERRHGHDLDRPADARGNRRSVRREEPQQPAAHRAEPGDPKFQRLRHWKIRASSSPSTQ